ncbi:MAG TPA: hypothetical protein VFB33_15325 [Candidatus Binataceae bacterium]|nr:hypothetical protein [Candidatus Binataceae bacterium]
MQRLAKNSMVAAAILCAGLLLRPALASAVTFGDATLNGTYAFQFNKFGTCPNIAVIVGVFDFNGSGNVTANFTVFNSNKGGAGPKTSTGSASGTYTVNPDGTGVIQFSSSGSPKFAFVIDSSASVPRLELITTNLGSSSCAESGYAIQQ